MKSKLNTLKDKLFAKVHGENLVYNTCWEDPRCDRELMQIDAESSIVMITSAGCNALDYTLDQPTEVNCIDVNFRQNSLLELKKALFKAGEYRSLFEMFGIGYKEDTEDVYKQSLRSLLPSYAQEFWDEKLFYFNKNEKKKSFYFFGTSGSFAWLFNKYLSSNKKRRKLITKLFECKTLEEQQSVYEELEPVLMNKMVRWLMNRHITMSLLGVPRPQRQLILEDFDGGVGEFLTKQLRHIFTQLHISDNYFWYLYTHGNYSTENCPEYLKAQNFDILKNNIDKIKTHTQTLAQFLIDNPGQYSHYVLLDHQDWLAAYDMEALEAEWKLILENSKPGTKILLRSAAKQIDFFPEFVKERLTFSEKAMELHQKDRVGTYGCTYLGIVK